MNWLRPTTAGKVAVSVAVAAASLPVAAYAATESELSAAVFGVAEYTTSNDLSNDDAKYFATKLLNNSWTPITTKFNADVKAANFVSAKTDDIVYFTGHGSTNGGLVMADQTYVNWSSIGTAWNSNDFEIAIWAACNVLLRNDWGKVLSGGGHHILGYRDISDEGMDKAVIGDFYSKALGSVGTSPLKIIDAWKVANTTYDELDWAVTGHKGNENDYFYVSTGMTSDITGTTDIYHWKNGGGYYLSLSANPDKQANESVKTGRKLKKESFDVASLAANVLDASRTTTRAINGEDRVYTDGRNNIIVYPSGAALYYREILNQPIGMTREEALKQSEKFIKKNGGIPKDAYLYSSVPQVEVDETTGQEVVTGYLMEYKRSADGIKIEGYAGDSIKVMVDSEGVNYYFRLWRQLGEATAANSKPIIDSEKAKEAGKAYLNHKFAKVAGTEIEVKQTELVYYSSPFTTEQEEITAAWKVVSPVANAYVDAYSGEVITTDNAIDNAVEQLDALYEVK